MDIKEFKKILFEKASAYGFCEYDLYYNSGSSFKVNVFKGEINEYKNTSHLGAGFRGLFNNKMGCAYTEVLDMDAVDFLLKNAKENAEILDEYGERIYKGSDTYENVPEINQKDISVDEKVSLAIQMEKEALALDKRVNLVQFSAIVSTYGDTYLANSHGLELHRKEAYATAYVYLSAKSADDVKTGYEVWQGKDFSEFDPKYVSHRAAEKAIKLLGNETVMKYL